MFRSMGSYVLLAVVALVTASGLGGCGGCNLVTNMPAELSIPIKDPTFAKFAAAGQQLELSASGHFAPGTYNIKGIPLAAEDGTEFKVTFKVPLSGKPVVYAKDATGTFSSSKELKAFGVPVPTQLSFTQGKVAGDVQFVRLLCVFLLELVNQEINSSQSNPHELAGIVNDINIEKVKLDLKPDSQLDLPGVQLAIAPDSSIEMDHLTVDHAFNYKGQCAARLNLRTGSSVKDDKNGLALQLGAGTLAITMALDCKDKVLNLSTQDGVSSGNDISVQPLSLTVKKDKASYTLKCTSAAVHSLKWSASKQVGSDTSQVNGSAQLLLTGTDVTLNKPDLALVFQVPAPVPLSLSLQQGDKGNTFQLSSPDVIVANNVALQMQKPDGKISLSLDKAAIGCKISSSADGVDVTLPKGDLTPRQLVMDRGKGRIIISMPGNSRISLTRDVHLSLNQGNGALVASIPMSLRGGTTSFTSPTKSLTLAGINGNMTLDLNQSGTSLSGKLNTTLEGQAQSLGGITTCGVKVGSLRVAPGSGHVAVELNDCQLTIPSAVLAKMISAKLPQSRTFKVNKELLAGSRWRYRNLLVKEAKISDLKLTQFKFGGPNVLLFSGNADVLCRGTVESSGFLSFLGGGNPDWATHPWQANSHVGGSGKVQFLFEPGLSLADSSIGYSAVMNMAVPDDLNLDWSQVAGQGNMVARAETGLVRGALKVANFALPPDQLAFKKDGSINLFSKPSQQIRSIKMEKCTAQAVGDNLQVNFASHFDL